MSGRGEEVAVALFGELFMADQLARARIGKVLPKGMQLSHFAVLNHLARIGEERSPAQLARAFHVTRGAMTNTADKREAPAQRGRNGDTAGYGLICETPERRCNAGSRSSRRRRRNSKRVHSHAG